VTFAVGNIDQARDAIRWMAKKRRMTVTALVQAAGLRSLTLVNFSSPNDTPRRNKDTNVSLMLELATRNDFTVNVRPIGGKPIRVSMPETIPFEIRGLDGELLTIPLTSLESLRVLANTLVLVTGESLTAIGNRAGVSAVFVGFVNGTGGAKDLRLNSFLQVLQAAGFEMVIAPAYANVREARLAAKAVSA
jgi:hypothetical protein